MAENPAGEEKKTFGTAVKAGIPVAANFNFQKPADGGGVANDDTANKGNEGEGAAAATTTAKDGETTNTNTDNKGGGEPNSSTGNQSPAKIDPPAAGELTEDQLKAYFEKRGIPFESMDSLKAKMTAVPPAKELTPEEKEKVAQEKKQKIVNEHLSRKGTVEQFAAFEKIAAAENKKELGLEKEISDLVKEGFSKEKAQELAKERYFQFTDEEIEAIEKPEEKAEAIKLREAGLKKLERKGAYLQNTAKDYLDILAKDLDEKDADAKKLEQHTSKVEDAIKKYERKTKLEIGQADDQKIDPIDFEYSDTALTSAKALLSNRSEFEKQLLTKDGHVNLDFILPHLVKSFSMDEAVKKSYLVAQDRTVEQFKSKFGTNLPIFGGPKKTNGTPGKITARGEPKVFVPVKT